jgi:lysophospholipase L1-like esterase
VLAALSFSSTTISGDSGIVIDTPSTISIGTSTATGITIGRSGVTTTFPGIVQVGGTISAAQFTPVPAGAKLICEGDSITYGYQPPSGQIPTAQRYCDVLLTLPTLKGQVSTSNYYNFAQSGNTIASVASRYVADVQPLCRAATAASPVYLSVFIGTNNLTSTDPAQNTTSSMETAIDAYWRQARTDGCKVIAWTIMPREVTGSYAAAMEPTRIAYNAWVRASSDYDYLMDADWLVGDPTNAAMFFDGLHPTPQGNLYLARQLDYVLAHGFNLSLIAPLFSKATSATNVTVTTIASGNYTLLATDQVVLASGGGTLTIPVEPAGTLYYLRNYSASATETIAGITGGDSSRFTLLAPGQAALIMSYGSGAWFLLGQTGGATSGSTLSITNISSGNYTLATTDQMVLAKGGGILTMPSDPAGQLVYLRNYDGSLAETIAGITGGDSSRFTSLPAGSSAVLVSYGSGTWFVVAQASLTGGVSTLTNRVASGFCSGTATSNQSAIALFGLGTTATTCTGSRGIIGFGPMPTAGTLSNFGVSCGVTGVNSSSGVFTMYDVHKGAASPTSLSITYGTTTASTMVSDASDTYNYAAGDIINVGFSTQASETIGICMASFNY